MKTNSTNGQGDSALEKSFWKIQHSTIAAGQSIVSPSGERFFACYGSPEKTGFVYDANISRDASPVIPARVKERTLERFGMIFSFPVQERAAIVAAMPVEYIDVASHE
jgi:hypothetical protein